MCNTQLTTGQEGRWVFFWLTTPPHFPLFVKRLTLIVSLRCECRRDMRWNTATGKVTKISQRQRKPKKQTKRKTQKNNYLKPNSKRKDKTSHHQVSASCTWTWTAATSPTTAGPLQLCSGFKISDLFWKIKPGNLESWYFKVWYTTQSCWRLEEAAAAAGSCATGLWQDRVLPGWWQQVHLSYLAVTYLIWSGKSGHLPPLQVGRQDNQRGRADWGLLQRCWLLQLWVWTTSGKLSMMILIDFKTFDDDSCKLDFENPGIATSCCCSISATDSKDQLKQTSTLCRG